MYPPTWGPLFHDVLWFLADNYPDEPTETQRQSMELLLRHLYANLPCLACMIDASLYVQLNPPNLASRPVFTQWIVDQHNYVNQKLGKKHDWTVEEARAAFQARHFGNLADLELAERKRVEDHALFEVLVNENKRLNEINARFAELQHSQTWCTPLTFGILAAVATTMFVVLVWLTVRKLRRNRPPNGF